MRLVQQYWRLRFWQVEWFLQMVLSRSRCGIWCMPVTLMKYISTSIAGFGL